MKYNELTAPRQRKARRSGRGISAGRGRTAGRGTKGQGARKSGGVRPGFEGGQMPLYMRLPHLRGFKSHRLKNDVVYTGQLEAIRKSQINNHTLYEAGLLSSPYANAKLLVGGELKSKKDVKLQAASATALAAIKKSGGSFTKIDRLPRPKKANDTIK
ncbi:50S ribosomal protein L15 [Candidatus Saccharibacteria bacterium]|nr:50S ribosomal protein L15 [Candidatus Saccharibacteria bacterium]